MEIELTDSLLLFLGEGNFSFSKAVSTAPLLASLHHQLIATDYIPELGVDLGMMKGCSVPKEKDPRRTRCNLDLLRENVKILKTMKHPVLFDVDATKLHLHKELLGLLREAVTTSKIRKVKIIFNFPHAKSKKMKIGLNRDLLRDFFISCDKLVHYLNCCEEEDFNSCCCDLAINVLPVVTLCAGQSGILEVESITRSWGDSWQINDMAAHGNFVCVSVIPFTQWYLYSMTSSVDDTNPTNFNPSNTYQSSYYRLQTAASFTTDKALTLEYHHKRHIQPRQTNRLHQSILRCRNDQAGETSVISEFSQYFGKFSNETIVSSQNHQNDLDLQERPYHHVVHCEKDLNKILNYLIKADDGERDDFSVVIEENQVKVHITQKDVTRTAITVGKINACGDDVAANTMLLYVDKLLELKYKCDYRLLLSNSDFVSGKSIYPHTHEFHISFWVNQCIDDGLNDNDNKPFQNNTVFSRDSFLEILLDVYGLMLKSLKLVEEYVQEKSGERRTSLCWVVQVQSLDGALSRLTAHQMYLQLRHELGSRLKIEVR